MARVNLTPTGENMLITPGTGATIGAETLESLTMSLIEFGQDQELTAARNPQSLNYITSNIDRDGMVLSSSLSFPCNITPNPDGTLLITSTDYLAGVTFTSGTGGTVEADNWVSALITATIMQRNREIDTQYVNNSGLTPIVWAIEGSATAISKAVFTANYNLPVEALLLPGGGTTYTAKVYLS